jgi:hypothetical protein
MQKRKFPFPHGLGGKAESRVDVLRFEVRKCAENVFSRHSFRNHADNGGNRNPQPPKTRNAVHLLGIDSDSGHDRGTDERGMLGL